MERVHLFSYSIDKKKSSYHAIKRLKKLNVDKSQVQACNVYKRVAYSYDN